MAGAIVCANADAEHSLVTVSAEEGQRIVALLRRLAPDWPCHTPTAASYLPGGYTHRNYRVAVADGVYALRVAASAALAEGKYLRALPRSIGPQVVARDRMRGHLLTRWIDGPVLAAAPPSPAEAGAYLAALHGAIPRGLRRYDPEAEVAALLRRARRRGCLHEDVAAAAGRLAWRHGARTGCHNDLNPWNVIRAADGWRTLDWEQAGDNDPLFDLAGLSLGLSWSEAEALACAEAAAQAGWQGRASPERLRQALLAYRLREYAWAVAQLAAGNRRKEVRQQAETMRAAILAPAAMPRSS